MKSKEPRSSTPIEKKRPPVKPEVVDPAEIQAQIADLQAKGERRAKKQATGTLQQLFKSTRFTEGMKAAGLAVVFLADGGCAVRRDFDILTISSSPDRSQLVSGGEREGEPTFAEMRRYLVSQLGEAEVRRLIRMDEEDLSAEEMRARQQELHEGPVAEVRGFQEVYHVADQRVMQFMTGAFSRTWIDHQNLRLVEATTVQRPMPAEYGVAGYEGGRCVTPFVGPSSVEVGMAGSRSEQEIDELLAHEIAHAGDFRQRLADPRDRLRFAYRFLKEAQNPDGPYFGYVADIDNVDPHVQMRNRLIEFIAESERVMFSPHITESEEDPERALVREFREMYGATQDRAESLVHLMREYATASDPQFDFERSQRFLAQRHSEHRLEESWNIMQESLQSIDDVELRETLQDLLSLPGATGSEVRFAQVHSHPQDDASALLSEHHPFKAALGHWIEVVNHARQFQQAVAHRQGTEAAKQMEFVSSVMTAIHFLALQARSHGATEEDVLAFHRAATRIAREVLPSPSYAVSSL